MRIHTRRAPHPPTPSASRLASLALLAPCGFCWAQPGTTCTEDGQHCARYLRIYRRGILNAAALAAVSNAAPYISAGTIIPQARRRAIAPPGAPS